MKEYKLFVPGRVGLIGELSDLVSPYLNMNKKLVPGMCLACRINLGIYSISKKDKNVIYSFNDMNFQCEMNEEKLLNEINCNVFYSYLCSTILYMFKKYHVGGININIYKMDLPMKIGLSSSAALCLTIVKAYNELYNLNLSDDEIIFCAHEGEVLSGSKCGYLDYVIIMNEGLCLLTFYDNKTDVESIKIKNSIYFLIVNLNSSKDTRLIMKTFNETLSNVDSKENSILNIVNINNTNLVKNAMYYLKEGNIKEFAECLNKAQELMDKGSDVCKEFIVPKLHSIMNDKVVQSLSYGIKSIGSGGDGSALVVCNNKSSMKKLNVYLLKEYNMKSIEFILDQNN